MKLLKKTFALMLSLILVVGVIPGSLMTAHAAGTGGGFTAAASSSDGWDLYIDKNGKLAWNSKGDTGKYTITVDETSVGRLVFDVPNVSKTSFDLKAEFEKHKIESGLYYVYVSTTNSGYPINSGTISTNYVSGQTKLAEPQQLQWTADGNQKWEPVAGATGYIFKLYDAKGKLRVSTTTTKTEATQWAEDGWWFTVQATADGYRNSNVAESPKYGTGTGGGFTAAASSLDGWDLYIDKNGKLAWNSKGDTGKYTITVDETSVGHLVFDVPNVSKTSFDLKAEFENRKIESGQYYVYVSTTNSGYPINSGTISTNYVSGQTKLATPQQLQWTADGKQKWEPVAGADGYIFNLYDAKGKLRVSTTTTKTEASQWAEDGWWFTVQATADGYRNSNVAESPKYGEVVTPPEPTVINELNATVTEPAIGAAPATTATTTGTDYTVSVSWWFEDATAFDETSFDGVFTGTSFEENVAYGVAIKFTAKEGKTIASEPTVTINGKTAHLFNYSMDGTAVTYSVKFDKLEAETPVPTEYDITVNGGTASANKAVAGTSITLTAEQIDGKVFSHWEVNGATVSDANAKETTFTMGNADVTAEAIYDDCDCKCHKGGIVGFFYKIVLFFQKLFGNNLVCNCGKKH